VGDRVGHTRSPRLLCGIRRRPLRHAGQVPDQIDFETAAAAMLQGLTAHFLAVSAYPLKEGVTALIHAAAGGVGLLLVQIAKMRGARVLGTVSTQAKADLAIEAGADGVIFYSRVRLRAGGPAPLERPRRGRGLRLRGAATFLKGLNLLRPRAPWSPLGSPAAPSRRWIRSCSARRDRSSDAPKAGRLLRHPAGASLARRRGVWLDRRRPAPRFASTTPTRCEKPPWRTMIWRWRRTSGKAPADSRLTRCRPTNSPPAAAASPPALAEKNVEPSSSPGRPNLRYLTGFTAATVCCFSRPAPRCSSPTPATRSRRLRKPIAR